MSFEKLLAPVVGIVRDTGRFILESAEKLHSGDVKEKSDNNFVTWVDQQSEERLVNRLTELFPGSGFIVEELTRPHHTREFTWIIDPLDGTTNFIHNLPMFCISVSLMHQGEQVMGVVYELKQEELFSACKGGGAFLNGRRIQVSQVKTVKDSLLATGFPYHDYRYMEPYMGVFDYLMRHSHGIRRLGSAAADLAYVACGRFEGFYEYGLSPWDVAAGSLLVTEAGGVVSDFSGQGDYLFGKEIIACNGLVYKEFLGMMREYFKK